MRYGKKICTLALIFVLLLGLCSCQSRYILARGENILGPYSTWLKIPTKNAGGKTTLDFWIGERVKTSDYEDYPKAYNGFLSKGAEYNALTGKPSSKHYVRYTVDNFPCIDSETMGIVDIEITDPEVMVYGLTTASTLEDFTKVFEQLGAQIYKTDGIFALAKLDHSWFRLRLQKNNVCAAIVVSTQSVGAVMVD